MSTIPLEDAVAHYFRDGEKQQQGEAVERRVAGRRALLLEYTLQGHRCWYCVFVKGDKLYEVIAANLETGPRSEQALMSGLEGVLRSFRLP